MSLKVNNNSITTNYSILASDVVLSVDAAVLTLTLPTISNIDIKDTKSFIIIANNAYTLVTSGELFAINGLTSYSVALGQNLVVTSINSQWYLNVYDVVSGGGSGITQLTGDVTAGPGSGSQVATIANNAVTNAKLDDVNTQTFKGRTTAGTGDPEDLTIAQAKTMLNLSGTNTGDQTITLMGDVTGSGTGSFAATIGNNTVTTAKMVQLGAYKFWANDTNVAANAAEHSFQDEGETAITATITFTGTTAPSGASTLSQWWLRVGDTVFYKFMITYATASTATTIVTLSFPSEFPAAFEPTALTAASAFLYFMDYSRAITTPAGAITSNATGCLKRNAADTANEFVFAHASGNYRTWHMGGSYRCS